MSELSRLIDLRQVPAGPVAITAEASECAALARRFALVRIDRLEASVTLEPVGSKIEARGRLSAKVVQSCAVSGEDLPVTIDEPVFIRFVPAGTPHSPDEEIELGAADCDEIEMDGTQFDLGEAIAQSLALAIDPFAVGPGAQLARQAAGLLDPDESGPFAALKALRKDA